MKQTIDIDKEVKRLNLFNKVADPTNYKLPTIPFITDNEEEADEMVEAIVYYAGGAMKSKRGINGKTFTVTSKGYYAEIGA